MVSLSFSELAQPTHGKSQRGGRCRATSRGLTPPLTILFTPASQPTLSNAVVQGSAVDSGVTLAITFVTLPVYSTLLP